MQSRLRNFLITVGGVASAYLLHPFYVRNIEYVIDQRGWDRFLDRIITVLPTQVAPILEAWIPGPFALGALSILTIWGLFEVLYVWRRKRAAMAYSDETALQPYEDANTSRTQDLQVTRSISSEAAPSVPINEMSLGAYVRSSQIIKSLDKAIALDLDVSIDKESLPTHIYEEEATGLGLATIAELDNLVRKHRTEIVRMAHHMPVSGTKMPAGYCLIWLFAILGAKFGLDKYVEVASKFKWSSSSRAWAEHAIEAYQQITASRR